MLRQETGREYSPVTVVVFGATGDLAQKKIFPALFHLYEKKQLPKKLSIIGFGRRDFSHDAFRQFVGSTIKNKPKEINSFLKLVTYQKGLFDDQSGYAELMKKIRTTQRTSSVCTNLILYLATPPQFYKTICEHIKISGLSVPCVFVDQNPWVRILIEKPFGRDAETAQELDAMLATLFQEHQIYRIDHYLAKETIRNLLAFRFANPLFLTTWNASWIQSVRISVLERQTIGNRGLFYDGVGALRDIGQNHILQMLALVAMDQPDSWNPDDIRKKRYEVFQSIEKPTPKTITIKSARGQYRGYRNELYVSAKSTTETYFIIKTKLTAGLLKNVPIILEGGKGMEQDITEIVVDFKTPSVSELFPSQEGAQLVYRVQPNEHISLDMFVKKPGDAMVLDKQQFVFDYKAPYQSSEFLDAYEKLLLDAIAGNQTLFVSTQEINESWNTIDLYNTRWHRSHVDPIPYTVGKTTQFRKSMRAMVE